MPFISYGKKQIQKDTVTVLYEMLVYRCELYRRIFLYNSLLGYATIPTMSYTEIQASATNLNYTEIQEVVYEQFISPNRETVGWVPCLYGTTEYEPGDSKVVSWKHSKVLPVVRRVIRIATRQPISRQCPQLQIVFANSEASKPFYY